MARDRGNENAGDTTQHGAARIEHWLLGWWRYLRFLAQREIAEWHTALLHRRKFTSPGEVTKMRQPAPRAPRATWYR